MKVSKPISKRVPVRRRHKIEKASAAKQRKQRKLAKKDPQWRSKIKKDPGIPNLFPYKDRILEEIEVRKNQKEQEQQRKREAERAARKQVNQDKEVLQDADASRQVDLSSGDEDDDEAMEMEGDGSNPMAALLASARARAAVYEEQGGESESDEDEDDGEIQTNGRMERSARSYAHLFESVLSDSDVILYVLDARDPPSTRSISVERQIAAYSGGSKRLLLVLNKIDLVPPEVLRGWLTFLRRYHPTIPLRASPPASNAKVFDHKALTQKATAETLLRALKSYGTSQNIKRAITVGVVGFPNVGKSSVINALVSCLGRRNAPAAAGAEAGVTTALKSIKLDSKVTLLDSPGVVFPDNASSAESKASKSAEETQAQLVLLNAVPPKAISDPIPAIRLLLSRQSADPAAFSGLLQHYDAPAVLGGWKADHTNDFLIHVARKRGRLGKGGVPNLQSAAMCVLQDWRDGRITGWVTPPVGVGNGTGKRSGGKSADEKQIVTEWAEEFKIDDLWDTERYEEVEDTMEA